MSSSTLNTKIEASSTKMLIAMVGIGIVCALLIVFTYEQTLPIIEKNKKKVLLIEQKEILGGLVKYSDFTTSFSKKVIKDLNLQNYGLKIIEKDEDIVALNLTGDHTVLNLKNNKINFKLLLNQSDIIEVNHEKIAIIGVENWGTPPFKKYGDLETSLKNAKHIPFKILLSHDPTHWNEEVVDKTDIALTLSGHTHGMQLGFNYKDLKWSPIKYKYQHWAGLYQHNKQYLYVNRGLGWLGFPGRIGMRPEISSFEVVTGQ